MLIVFFFFLSFLITYEKNIALPCCSAVFQQHCCTDLGSFLVIDPPSGSSMNHIISQGMSISYKYSSRKKFSKWWMHVVYDHLTILPPLNFIKIKQETRTVKNKWKKS